MGVARGAGIRVDWVPKATGTVPTALERGDDLSIREASPADVEEAVAAGTVDCIVSRQDLDGTTGLELLRSVRAESAAVPFVLYPRDGSERLASEAVRAGVTEYLPGGDDGVSTATLTERVRELAGEDARDTADAGEQRYQRMLDTVGDPVYALDTQGRLTTVNDTAVRVTGYDRSELVGAHVSKVLEDEDVLAGTKLIERLVNGDPERGTVEMDLVTASGERVPCENHIALLPSPDGSFAGTVGVMRDISERRRRERALEALHDATREMMAAERPTTVAELGSETAADVLHLPLNAVLLYDPAEGVLVPAARTDAADALLDLPDAFEPGEGIAWLVFEQGEPRIFEDVSASAAAYNPDTEVRSEFVLPLGEHGVLLVGSRTAEDFDETDVALAKVLAANLQAALATAKREQTLREREAELERQNERLEEFASVVSHDLRNPLNVAQGRLELYAETGDRRHYEKVDDAHSRMGEIIDEVLAMARRGQTVSELARVDLAAVATDAWRTVDTSVATLEAESAPSVEADRGRVRQLFENLFRNAVEHGGEDVTVRVGALGGGDPTGFFVADDGPGIPDDQRDRVLESGYSTTDSGTGFGLAIVEQIVAAHGWDITVTEAERGGARIEVTGVSVVDP